MNITDVLLQVLTDDHSGQIVWSCHHVANTTPGVILANKPAAAYERAG